MEVSIVVDDGRHPESLLPLSRLRARVIQPVAPRAPALTSCRRQRPPSSPRRTSRPGRLGEEEGGLGTFGVP